MTFPLSGAADVLRAAGLTVMEMPGWATRGESDGGFTPRGVLLHHDAMGLGYNSNPADDHNVPDYMSQPGNLGSQLWVSRAGVWWCMAAGRKWHAGTGQWRSIPQDDGNSYLIGVETDHTVGDPWEAPQLTAIDIGCRALAQHYQFDVDQWCCGHREYAPTRKIDPDCFDLDAWRTFLKGTTPAVTVTGASHTAPPAPSAPPVLDRKILEFIMSLPGTPAGVTYDRLINDIANIVLAQLPLSEHDRAIAANNVGHGLNADGGKH